MRCFVAVDLPSEVKDELRRIQSQLKNGTFKLVNDFHITLNFLGEKNQEEVERIIEKLSQVRFKGFSLTLNEVGVFPSRKFVRVIWVGTSGQAVYELQNLIKDSLFELGIIQDKPFLSHITIARVKYADKVELLRILDNTVVKPISFNVSEFKLKESTLTPQGPVYKDIKSFSLMDS